MLISSMMISREIEKELAQNMIQDLSEKLKPVNKHGMRGVVTTMTTLLPLIRCEEGSSLALATDQLVKALIERSRDVVFKDDTSQTRESFFKGIPETRRFLDEATEYFGEEYTYELRCSLGFKG